MSRERDATYHACRWMNWCMMNAMARKAIEDEGHIYISISKVIKARENRLPQLFCDHQKTGCGIGMGKNVLPKKRPAGGKVSKRFQKMLVFLVGWGYTAVH